MARNRGRGNSRKKRSSPKPTIQVTNHAPSSQMASTSPKRRFHIDWTQVNFWQFIILLFIPILLTIVFGFPILNDHKQLRPEAAIIAGSFITAIGIVFGALSAGVFKVKKVNPFHPTKFKPIQAVIAIISGILLSLVLLGIAIPPPSSQSTPNPISTENTACTAAPTLTSPVDGQNLTSRSVTLTWEAPQGCVPDGYTVRISVNRDPEARPWIVDEGWAPTDYTYTFSADGTYYWHIRACKPCTPFHPGNWAIRIFTIHT